MSQRCFNGMITLIKSMLPNGDKLPENFYQAKRLVRGLGMEYQKIDVCPNFCTLYYKSHKDNIVCDECKEPRYEPCTINKKSKLVPQKILRYLPITPRLQRMYMTRTTAERMRWHKEGLREKPGIIVHSSDAEAWKTFDLKHPDFAYEVRNVRLGLTTDGFMPYNSSATPYSCWAVFVFPYNLPPIFLMKEDSMFLALIIPGLKHPGRDIDVVLQPLIDELKELWIIRKMTYNVSRKEYYLMRAYIVWTVSDYPAFEMLCGWGTKGRLACFYCLGTTKAFQLRNGGKTSWFDCHRCLLLLDHQFRRDKKNFLKGRVENDPPSPRLTGEELFEIVNQLPPIKWGKKNPLKQISGYGDSHHWQKKSIFLEFTLMEG
jgi:Transposase family tnp2